MIVILIFLYYYISHIPHGGIKEERMNIKKENLLNVKTILILAIPVIFENIFQIFLGTNDTFFAGQLHDNAIAGIGVTNLIVNIFIAFYTAVSVGVTAVVARNIGKKDYEQANKAVKQSIILGIVIGFLVGFISLIFCKPLLKLSGASDEILEYAIPYYMIVAVPSIFLCLSLILSSCLRAAKDTKTPMILSISSNILDIILNFIFIKLGWGIFGLGLSTTLSRCISVVIMIIKLSKGTSGIKLDLRNWHFEKEYFFTIARIGLPAGIEKLVMRFGQLVYNGMIISIGTGVYVAHNIAGSIESYSYIPAMGFGVATTTLVGVSLGEKNPKQAKKLTFLADGISTICMLGIGIIFFIFAPQLAGIFTKTKEIKDMIISVLRLIALFQPFVALTQILTSALQGAGDTKFPMYATLIGIWVIRVGVGYILAVQLGFGLLGVWWGYALDLLLRSILLLIRFLRGKWQTIVI